MAGLTSTTMFISRKVIQLAEIAFPLGLEGTAQLPYTRKALRNCWNDNGRIIQRPGSTLNGTTGLVARGSFEWNGGLYAVASQSLIKITNVLTGAFTTIGTITGTADIRTANGFNTVAIVVKGGAQYTLDKSDTLVDISGNTNFVPCNSVTHMNGRFIYIPSDGDPAFFSDVGAAGTVQTSSFFDAEQLPDNNSEVFQLNNILYIGGDRSIQSFLDRGLDPVPYQPQTGRIDAGIIGGVVETQDDGTGTAAVLFIGKKKGQVPAIFAQIAGGAPKVSNDAIDAILETYTETQLSEVVVGRYVWRGDDIVYFTLANHAFGFYKGNWHGLDTLIGGANVPWQAGYIQEFGLNYYSFFAGNLSILDDSNKDAGNAFVRVIDGGIEQGASFNAQSLQYHMSQGYNASIGSVYLAMSDDNVLYGPYVSASTGAIGNYGVELDWNYPGGLGIYDRFMGYRLQTGEDVNFSGTKLYIETR